MLKYGIRERASYPVIFLCIMLLPIKSMAQLNDNDILNFLKKQYLENFNNIKLDSFLNNYSKTFGIIRYIDNFANFKNIRFAASTDYIKIEKLFKHRDIKKEINNLPYNFFQNLLESEEQNTEVLYLLLAYVTDDTSKIIHFFDKYLNEKTEIEARAFLNTMYGLNVFSFQTEVKSAFLNSNSSYFYDYTIHYITRELARQIYISESADGITAGNDIDFFVYYKKIFNQINSQETFIHKLKHSNEFLDEIIAIDIGVVKNYSFLPMLDNILSDENIPPKIKLNILSYELFKKQDNDTKSKLENSLRVLYTNYCKKVKNTKVFGDKVSDEVEKHNSLVEFLCTANLTITDSLLENMQEKLNYDWQLFYHSVKNNKKISEYFFKTHIQVLYAESEKLFAKKSTVSIYDTTNNIYNHSFYNINRFFPFINYQQYYYGVSEIQKDDSLVKNLFTSTQYHSYLESFVLAKVNHINIAFSRKEITKLLHSSNAFLSTYGYFYVFNEKKDYLKEILRSENRSDVIFTIADLCDYSDNKKLLSKYFKKNITPSFTSDLCNRKLENATFVHSALNYFKNNLTKTSSLVIKKMIKDTLSCMKTNLIILTKFPSLINDCIESNKIVKNRYYEMLCSVLKRREWTPLFLYLSPPGINMLTDCVSY